VLHRKYPQTHDILRRLLVHNGQERSSEGQERDNDEASGFQEPLEQISISNSSSSEWGGLSPPPSPSLANTGITTFPTSTTVNGSGPTNRAALPNHNISYHTSISAHSLASHKPIRRKGPYNKIVFNFPHVGGLSTDVNRQVRANQELLVAFFKSCKPLLASKSNPVRQDLESDLGEGGYSDMNDEHAQNDGEEARTSGQVIVSLFEGEPYSLWNIRDLARHCGFKVVTSWRFPWEAYPGYQHARTIGEIVSKSNSAEKAIINGERQERRGAWKGEEREARGYVFEIIDGDDQQQKGVKSAEPQIQGHPTKGSGKKRRQCGSSSDSASDS
jgi:Domain of unknown function (DUF2431)